MSAHSPQRSDALPRKQLAQACASKKRIAKVEDLGPRLTTSVDDAMYACLDDVRRAFDLSDQQMADRLGIHQSNYSRRSFNIARVQRLELPQRQLFVEKLAATVKLRVDVATPHEQLRIAAKLAILNLLELLEAGR